jgi:hypothetical protein
MVANENLTQAFGTRYPAAGYRSPDQLEKWIGWVTRLADPKVSNDHISDTSRPHFQRLRVLAVSGGVSFVAVVQSTDLTQSHDCPISGGRIGRGSGECFPSDKCVRDL